MSLTDILAIVQSSQAGCLMLDRSKGRCQMKRERSRGTKAVITLNLMHTTLITQPGDISLTDSPLHGKQVVTYLLRMNDTCISKLWDEHVPNGRRNVGQPRKRWRDKHTL
jgi:hypothetical protein